MNGHINQSQVSNYSSRPPYYFSKKIEQKLPQSKSLKSLTTSESTRMNKSSQIINKEVNYDEEMSKHYSREYHIVREQNIVLQNQLEESMNEIYNLRYKLMSQSDDNTFIQQIQDLKGIIVKLEEENIKLSIKNQFQDQSKLIYGTPQNLNHQEFTRDMNQDQYETQIESLENIINKLENDISILVDDHNQYKIRSEQSFVQKYKENQTLFKLETDYYKDLVSTLESEIQSKTKMNKNQMDNQMLQQKILHRSNEDPSNTWRRQFLEVEGKIFELEDLKMKYQLLQDEKKKLVDSVSSLQKQLQLSNQQSRENQLSLEQQKKYQSLICISQEQVQDQSNVNSKLQLQQEELLNVISDRENKICQSSTNIQQQRTQLVEMEKENLHLQEQNQILEIKFQNEMEQCYLQNKVISQQCTMSGSQVSQLQSEIKVYLSKHNQMVVAEEILRQELAQNIRDFSIMKIQFDEVNSQKKNEQEISSMTLQFEQKGRQEINQLKSFIKEQQHEITKLKDRCQQYEQYNQKYEQDISNYKRQIDQLAFQVQKSIPLEAQIQNFKDQIQINGDQYQKEINQIKIKKESEQQKLKSDFQSQITSIESNHRLQVEKETMKAIEQSDRDGASLLQYQSEVQEIKIEVKLCRDLLKNANNRSLEVQSQNDKYSRDQEILNQTLVSNNESTQRMKNQIVSLDNLMLTEKQIQASQIAQFKKELQAWNSRCESVEQHRDQIILELENMSNLFRTQVNESESSKIQLNQLSLDSKQQQQKISMLQQELSTQESKFKQNKQHEYHLLETGLNQKIKLMEQELMVKIQSQNQLSIRCQKIEEEHELSKINKTKQEDKMKNYTQEIKLLQGLLVQEREKGKNIMFQSAQQHADQIEKNQRSLEIEIMNTKQAEFIEKLKIEINKYRLEQQQIVQQLLIFQQIRLQENEKEKQKQNAAQIESDIDQKTHIVILEGEVKRQINMREKFEQKHNILIKRNTDMESQMSIVQNSYKAQNLPLQNSLQKHKSLNTLF